MRADHTSQGPDLPHDHEHFTIIVNGRPKRVTDEVLSYDDIITLAYGSQPPTGPNVVITVTFRRGHEQGSVGPGESVHIHNGMILNVTATDRS